jgi:hypothetical protein
VREGTHVPSLCTTNLPPLVVVPYPKNLRKCALNGQGARANTRPIPLYAHEHAQSHSARAHHHGITVNNFSDLTVNPRQQSTTIHHHHPPLLPVTYTFTLTAQDLPSDRPSLCAYSPSHCTRFALTPFRCRVLSMCRARSLSRPLVVAQLGGMSAATWVIGPRVTGILDGDTDVKGKAASPRDSGCSASTPPTQRGSSFSIVGSHDEEDEDGAISEKVPMHRPSAVVSSAASPLIVLQ